MDYVPARHNPIVFQKTFRNSGAGRSALRPYGMPLLRMRFPEHDLNVYSSVAGQAGANQSGKIQNLDRIAIICYYLNNSQIWFSPFLE